MNIDMSLVSTDQTIQIISILASGLFIGWQIRSAKKREIEFKIHQQRKEQYAKLLNLLKNIFTASKNSQGNPDQMTFNFDQDYWFDVQLGMSMYVSEDVLKAYIHLTKTAKENPIMSVRELGDILLIMRKKVGFKDSNLSSRQVLSTFINDIYLPQYDEYFK